MHVTHDQEEAMTMADRIAVMNKGRIEQLGAPSELYETPRTSFVANFLGVSNLLSGTAAGADTVRLDDGTELRVPLGGRTGRVAVGIRPEKLRVDGDDVNRLAGRVTESAYVGVATQLIVSTPAGALTVYVQNAEPGSRVPQPGDPITLTFSPEATFVVDDHVEGFE